MLDCASGGTSNCFEDFEREADERENVAGGVAEAVGISVLPTDNVLVAVHDLDAPMLAVELGSAFGVAWQGVRLVTR